MSKKMLIDATHPEETRVVVADGDRVEDFDFESVNKRQLAGNIYLAKVTRVEPSLQAAFVEYGGNRHGFLAFAEIHPDYYQIPVADREALLAEEAEAERQAEAEEEQEKPKPRTRSRRRSRGAKAKDAAEPVTEASEEESLLVETPETNGESSQPQTTAAEEIPVQDPDGDKTPEQSSEFVSPEDAPETETETEAEAETEAEPDAEGSPKPPIAASADNKDEIVSAEIPEDVATSPADTSAVTEDVTGPEAALEDSPPQQEDAVAKDDIAADTEAEAVHDTGENDQTELRPRRPRARRYKIQEVIKVRQVMLVQVVKEERGNKGAALTTYLSLAGRYCVLMPNTARGGGISRKITTATDRKKLKDIAHDLEVPQGAGLIIRTAGAKRTKTEIKRDYEFLIRQWDQIRDLTMKSSAPALIYEEGSLIKRAIRDLYTRDIDEICVEGAEGYREAKDYMKMLMPSHTRNVKAYTDATPLFTRYQVEATLGAMFNPTVQLKSGGYIVIGVTEALVAIDVNSGRATKESSIEETALKTNLEAADEVAKQLRLRDLAGLIVIDFIDMDERRNNSAVEKRLKEALKNDRARIQTGRISGFGLMEMSRQRLRPGMIEMVTQPCPACQGTGIVRSDASLALSILREIQEEANRRRCKEIVVSCPVQVANYLINYKREALALLEARFGIAVRIEANTSLPATEYKIEKLRTATRILPPVTETAAVQMDAIYDDLETSVEEDTDDDLTSEAISEEDDEQPKKRRRRRRGGRRRNRKSEDEAQSTDPDAAADESGETTLDAVSSDAPEADVKDPEPAQTATEAEDKTEPDSQNEANPEPAKKPRRRRRSSKTAKEEPAVQESEAPAAPQPAPAANPEVDVADVADTAVSETSSPEGRTWTAPEDTPPAEDKPKKRGWWAF